MNRTITFYNPQTGKLGPVITDDENIILQKISDFPFYLEGHHDIDNYLYDSQTNSLVDKPIVLSENDLRTMRNSLLDSYRWTVMPDSPLTEGNKEDWLSYLRELQGMFKDGFPENIIWPDKPLFIYEE